MEKDTNKPRRSLFEELNSMATESKETSSGSIEGLELTQNIVKDTENLNKQIVTENEIIVDKEPILHIDDLIESNKNWLKNYMDK